MLHKIKTTFPSCGVSSFTFHKISTLSAISILPLKVNNISTTNLAPLTSTQPKHRLWQPLYESDITQELMQGHGVNCLENDFQHQRCSAYLNLFETKFTNTSSMAVELVYPCNSAHWPRVRYYRDRQNLGILFVNRQVHNEAFPTFFQNCHVTIVNNWTVKSKHPFLRLEVSQLVRYVSVSIAVLRTTRVPTVPAPGFHMRGLDRFVRVRTVELTLKITVPCQTFRPMSRWPNSIFAHELLPLCKDKIRVYNFVHEGDLSTVLSPKKHVGGDIQWNITATFDVPRCSQCLQLQE